MREILEQISRIDAIAYENEQKNKAILNNEKLRLENEMKKYREHRLKEANESARLLYDQITKEARKDYQMLKDKNRELLMKFEDSFSKVEKAVIERIMNRLFS